MTQNGEHHKIDGAWDLIIAHPPCTYLTVSGNAHFREDRYNTKAKARWIERVNGIKFFMDFVVCNAKSIAIENPIGIMSNVYRKPDQIIQPYEFGEHARKATCLWLKNLPKLEPTEIVDQGEIGPDGHSVGAGMYKLKDENGKSIPYDDPRTSIIRSRTFPGIAKAMAEQWG